MLKREGKMKRSKIIQSILRYFYIKLVKMQFIERNSYRYQNKIWTCKCGKSGVFRDMRKHLRKHYSEDIVYICDCGFVMAFDSNDSWQLEKRIAEHFSSTHDDQFEKRIELVLR